MTEQEIQEMQAKLASLQADKDASDAKAAKLQADLDNVAAAKAERDKVIEDAKAKAAELEQKAAALQAENAALKETNDKLDPKPVQIEVNGKKYEFACPSFTHKNDVYKATEVAAALAGISPTLTVGDLTKEQTTILETIQHLVSTAPGVLVEVE